jgi:uncharacterized protein
VALGSLNTFFSKQNRAYTGKELRPHFLLSTFGLRGSAVGAFCGPCKVETEYLVDWEDRLKKDFIEAQLMLHFIGEFFGVSLQEGVLIQRLFMALMRESLHGFLKPDQKVYRTGDDLFIAERKLSVSIVTASPVSQLLHCGINLDSTGAPVAAIGLFDLGATQKQIEEMWVPKFFEQWIREWETLDWACAKVRPVV